MYQRWSCWFWLEKWGMPPRFYLTCFLLAEKQTSSFEKRKYFLWREFSFGLKLLLKIFFVPLRVLVFGCDWRSGEKLDSFQSRKVRKTSFGNTVWKFQEFTLTILKNREFPWNQLTFLLLFHKMVFFKWE